MTKKLINLSLIGILLSILFSSCVSNLTITKRHYNKGYYVLHKNKVKDVSHNSSTNNVADNKIISPSTISAEKKQNSLIENRVLDSTFQNKTEVAKNNTVETNNIEKKQNVLAPKLLSSVLKSKVEQIQKNIAQISNKLPKPHKIGNATEHGDGYSLFWIVILVLIILWAIGVISSGFLIGSLINLLLLVALILLILWLLRVI